MSDEWETAGAKKPKNVNKPIIRSTAMTIQIKENIENLCNTLMSEESVRLQTEGYRYMGVIKEGKVRKADCVYLDVGNKYGDILEYKLRSPKH